MRAVVVEQWGGAESLVEREMPRPEPGWARSWSGCTRPG